MRRWTRRAQEVPSATIRADALHTIATKRGHIDGAALFTTLPNRRNRPLLRLLVAYELIWDFLDTVNERGAAAGQKNGRQLHQALIDALDPRRPLTDYYRHHPCKDDDGYLRELVQFCRANASKLPSYDRVLPHLVREAERAQVLGINHDLDGSRRDRDLQVWASQIVVGADFEWFELSGAASASMTVHALLALAAEPCCSESEIAATCQAYFPWISAATTMLDSYVDQTEDVLHGDHSYIAHYHDEQTGVEQVTRLLRESLRDARRLPNGERHIVLIASMAAMYLSKDSARVSALEPSTQALAAAGGSLTKFLLPILRLWRTIYSQRAA